MHIHLHLCLIEYVVPLRMEGAVNLESSSGCHFVKLVHLYLVLM